MTAGLFTPRPGAAPVPGMVIAHAGLELRLLLRNGEQLLLLAVLPILLLVAFTLVDVVDVGPGRRVDVITPGILALAVMSAAFTGQAIQTGFERRYGVLKRLGATPLPRLGLLTGKTLAVLAVEALQLVLVATVALLLGWSPGGAGPGRGPGAIAVVVGGAVLLLAGTAAFSALGLLLAGTLRAEATLAVANLIYVVLLLTGGVIVPVDQFPAPARVVLELNPLDALAEGLRAVFLHGAVLPGGPLLVLTGWALAAGAAAAATFRWE